MRLKQIKPADVLLWVIMITGVWLLSKVYFEERSLYIDEANLARNIAERSHLGFFETLDYAQYAPPLYLSMAKVGTQIFGQGELGIRFVSFVSGIGVIFMLYFISRKVISNPVMRLIPLILVLFSFDFVRYSTEGKQYTMDVLVCLLAIWTALKVPPERLSIQSMVVWLAVGVVSIWLSMPVAFVLAGVGCYYAIHFIQQKEQKKLMLWAGCCAGWIMSFVVYYLNILHSDIHSDYLNDYHADYFLPLLPSSADELNRGVDLIVSLMRYTSGPGIYATIVGSLTFGIGSVVMFQKQPKWLWLFVAPILFCLIASGFQQYSLVSRLVLFLVPLIALTIGVGNDHVSKWHHLAPLGIIILWLPVFNVQGGFYYLNHRFVIEESRPLLMQIMNDDRGETIYVHDEAVPAAKYYRDHHPDSMLFRSKPMYLAHVDETPDTIKAKTYWVYYTHLLGDSSTDKIRRGLHGLPITDSIVRHNAAAYLVRH